MKPYEKWELNELFYTFVERIDGAFNEDDNITDGAYILLEELTAYIERLEKKNKETLLKDVIEVISYAEDIPIERLKALIDSVYFRP